jgi:hypothetical protein
MADDIPRLIDRLRKAAPAGVRRLFRLSRHVLNPGAPSPAMPPELVEGCRFAASRLDLVAGLPKGGIVAEVGTDRGDFARAILDRAAPAALHLIDRDLSRVRADVAGDPRVRLHEGASQACLGGFPDAGFDWIYVDADHSYEGVRRDAALSASKVRPGGYLVFNDFAHVDPYLGSYGVHRAVMEFLVERRWPVAWFAFEPHGLYDIALRRPEDG